MNEEWKCDKCGLTWYFLRGTCAVCGGLIKHRVIFEIDAEIKELDKQLKKAERDV